MSIADRKAREKQELHDKIFYGALELIQQEGVDHFSIRKLAERIEYSPRTIYLYFESKHDLFNQIIDKAFGSTLSKYQAIDQRRKGKNSREILKAKIDLHMETAIENPVFYASVIKIIQSSQFVLMDKQKAVIRSLSTDVSSYLEGRYDANTIRIKTQLAIAFLQSATMALLGNPEYLEHRESYQQTVYNSLFNGIIA